MNIVFYCTEFLNKNGTDLVDGGIAHEYFKWASELIGLGHYVTIVVCKDKQKLKKVIYKDITVYECDFYRYLKKLRFYVFILSFGKIYIKYGDGIFFYLLNIRRKIDIIQICSDCLLFPITLPKIPYCIRIACDIWEYLLYSPHRVKDEKIERYIGYLRKSKNIFGPSYLIANKVKKIS